MLRVTSGLLRAQIAGFLLKFQGKGVTLLILDAAVSAGIWKSSCLDPQKLQGCDLYIWNANIPASRGCPLVLLRPPY